MSPSMSGKQPTAGSSSPPNDHLVQDAVVLDMPPLNRFSINVPSEPSRPISTPISSDRPALSSSESGQSSDDDGDDGDESGQDRENGDTFDANYSPTISTTIRPSLPDKSALIFPHFSRAFSLPLPSQLGHLKHPHRPLFSLTRPSYSESASPEAEQFKELSLELADSVQMVIQTMLQISPTQILDPAKEQFSACSMAVPAPSMSAMLTAMKNLNYISANMAAFAAEETLLEDTPLFSNRKHNDFDIGELLQSVGDALSASVAQAGVDLVLFHGDATLKHVWVKGDEPCMSYLLSHLIRQILTTCQRGDTIELGLFVNPLSSPRRQNSLSSETDEDDPFRTTSYGEGSLECVVEIFHRFLPAGTSEGLSRPQPTFLALATRRLLSQLGATLSDHTPSFDGSLEIGRSSRLSFALDSGLSPQPTPNAIDETQSSNEPTLEQLSTFVDSLKGKKVHLHSSSKSPFAHHLTSYLTTWGMDVSHISTEGGEESLLAPPSSPTTVVSSSNNLEGYTPSGIPPKVEPPRPPKSQPVSFVVIDDDVAALKERLQSIRDEQNYPLHLNSRKRPSLASHHRPRSTSQVTRLPPTVATPHASVILHFTSLANYKATKNLVQSFLDFYRSTVSPLPVPEIMVIPKPAGPRRLLTALHTAATRPPVDPFFSPIATTPGTPSFGISYIGSPLQQHQQSVPRTSSLHRPSGSRSNSDRSSRSTQILENHGNLPPSPLSMQDSTEYFSDTVTKLGETPVKLGVTPRAGVILQSPDGQPAGIFFSPRAEKSNVLSSYSMERDRGQLSVSSGSRRSLSSKEGPSVTFSSLHEVASIEGPSPRSSEKEKDSPTTSRQYSRGNVSPTPTDAPDTQTGRGVSVESVSRKSAIATPTISPPGSPMVEPSISSLRNVRRPKMDSKGLSPAPSSKKGKSPADNNIVPPSAS
ncbi:hypothetical protein D9757_011539 [Collybiopsis confluens]|uniref:Uncharacterized protein n=1 Tax=Collybiopsis confluens TaxID=2823264 RepID=A0A8H5LL65_9AGAR|nr:hypothetical protein D9757_011539 [Collybiopsis confluens]